jgi:mitochondrial inner membrane protease subunit 1
MPVWSNLRNTASWAVRLGCGVHVVHSNFFEITETYGESMLPTLNYSGDYVSANKLCKLGRHCEVGDVIIASKPTNPTQRVCKRITGMPGDRVLVDPSTGDYGTYITVPKGHCWVTGDNLDMSLDSRSYGALPLGLIKGKVIGAINGEGFRWIENNLENRKGV